MNKALFILSNFTKGGIQTQAIAIAKHLQKNHHFIIEFWCVGHIEQSFVQLLEKESFIWRKDDTLSKLFVNSYYKKNKLQKFKLLFKAWSVLYKIKVDVVFPFSQALAVNLLFKVSFIKLSFWFERGGHISPKPNKQTILDKIVSFNAPTYVANSEHGANALAIMRGVKSDNVKVIRNEFVPIVNSNKEVFDLTQYKITTDDFVFVMVANFFSEKDHETLIRAWQLIPSQYRAKLLFAGLGGPSVCIEQHEKMKHLSEQLNLSDDIVFLGKDCNIASLLEVADVGILSSFSEGCPNAVLEYMSAKLPLLVSNIPGIEEIIPNNNFVFQVNDVNSCYIAIIKLLTAKSELANIGKANYKYLLENFCSGLMYKRYSELISVVE
jgi:glycosyltransferase involved in cell wall biosynthesis